MRKESVTRSLRLVRFGSRTVDTSHEWKGVRGFLSPLLAKKGRQISSAVPVIPFLSAVDADLPERKLRNGLRAIHQAKRAVGSHGQTAHWLPVAASSRRW
jgi:hypothetical protein